MITLGPCINDIYLRLGHINQLVPIEICLLFYKISLIGCCQIHQCSNNNVGRPSALSLHHYHQPVPSHKSQVIINTIGKNTLQGDNFQIRLCGRNILRLLFAYILPHKALKINICSTFVLFHTLQQKAILPYLQQLLPHPFFHRDDRTIGELFYITAAELEYITYSYSMMLK